MTRAGLRAAVQRADRISVVYAQPEAEADDSGSVVLNFAALIVSGTEEHHHGRPADHARLSQSVRFDLLRRRKTRQAAW